jgi:hypothetical protein
MRGALAPIELEMCVKNKPKLRPSFTKDASQRGKLVVAHLVLVAAALALPYHGRAISPKAPAQSV